VAVGQLQRALIPAGAAPRLGRKGFSYLVESVVQQDNLCLACDRVLPHQHIAWMGITVHEAIDKDHLAIHLAQVAGDLEDKGGGGSSAPSTPVSGASLLPQPSHCQEETKGSRWT
jgi:hypothetical protein